MKSTTLKKILEHWSGDPTKEPSPINLPFDVEMFCSGMDNQINDLEKKLAIAREALVFYADPTIMASSRAINALKRLAE